MTRSSWAAVLFCAMLVAASNAKSVKDGDDAPLPMRTVQPIVYATPISHAVILEFKLYDNKTWCWLYVRRDTWGEARTRDGQLPDGVDMGQLQCERR